MRLLKALARRLLPHWMVERKRLTILDSYATKSYSQEGEDMILRRVFAEKSRGFYVDVGAHHPKRFSNTYYFYKRGWRGINIDAMPGSMRAFRFARPADTNIEAPISSKKETLTFYMFDDPALNGFSTRLAEQRSSSAQPYRIIGTMELETVTLSEILAQHLPKGQSIDFMSIDVEGLDLDVLLSNDWSQFKPRIILVEILESKSMEDVFGHKITALLKSKGYSIFAKSANTVFFAVENGQ